LQHNLPHGNFRAQALRPFGEVSNSNLEVVLSEKVEYNEDLENESKKELKKEQPSSSAITPLQSLFKMEAKLDIKPYQGEINVVKLNNWLH